MSSATNVLRDVGVMEPFAGLVGSRLQPSPGVGSVLTDLFTYGHGLSRRSCNGVEYHAGRDTRQAAHHETLPYVSHPFNPGLSLLDGAPFPWMAGPGYGSLG